MAKQVKLSARPRVESGRNAVKKVHARGSVPAVIYGGTEAPANLEVGRKELDALLAHAVGENILVELEIKDGAKTTNRLSLIQEVQHHPVGRQVVHVDFHAVSTTEEIEADVVLEPVGEPIGVKTYGGLFQQNLRSLTINCLPQDLPEIITVDVSHLNIDDAVHVRDIKLPNGVSTSVDPELTAFIVSEPTVAEEPTPAAAAAAPEVLKEKKAEGAAPEGGEKK